MREVHYEAYLIYNLNFGGPFYQTFYYPNTYKKSLIENADRDKIAIHIYLISVGVIFIAVTRTAKNEFPLPTVSYNNSCLYASVHIHTRIIEI